MINPDILVLDFDGVICDGLNECLLSAWNTWHKRGVDAFSEITLAEIPQAFSQRFAHARNFVRHSGHFLVPFVTEQKTFESWNDFESAYANIPSDIITQFLAKFESYRLEVIKNRRSVWVGMHSFYEGMIEILCKGSRKIYVVSGKDAPSIDCLLASQDIQLDHEHIFAGLRNKLPALHSVRTKENAEFKDMVFCDDNLSNILEASQQGFSVLWAGWGYQTPEDRERAQKHHISPMSLNEFLAACSL